MCVIFYIFLLFTITFKQIFAVMDKKEVGIRIKRFMKVRGLKQQQVADDLNLKQSTVSSMISGQRDTIRLAIEMSEFYNVSREEFFGGSTPVPLEIKEHDMKENGLTSDEKQILINKLESLYNKHQQLLEQVNSVMKEISAINKILIIGVE